MITRLIRPLTFAALLNVAKGASATPIATGLELWLDASAIDPATTSVSTWTDPSGNGRDATATAPASTPTYIASNPVFSNHATVSFDGGDNLNSALASSLNITGNNARTIFFAFSQDSLNYRNILGYGTQSGNTMFDIAGSDNSDPQNIEYNLITGSIGVLGGTLEIVFIDGFVAALNDTFDFLQFDSLSGAFDTVLLPSLSGNLKFLLASVDHGGKQTLRLQVVETPAPATFALLLSAFGCFLPLLRRKAQTA